MVLYKTEGGSENDMDHFFFFLEICNGNNGHVEKSTDPFTPLKKPSFYKGFMFAKGHVGLFFFFQFLSFDDSELMSKSQLNF